MKTLTTTTTTSHTATGLNSGPTSLTLTSIMSNGGGGGCDSASVNSSSHDSSSGTSSSVGGNFNAFSSPVTAAEDWFSRKNVVSEESALATKEDFWEVAQQSILDDPFDAEWAALATRNNSKNATTQMMTTTAAAAGVVTRKTPTSLSPTNPFLNRELGSNPAATKTFEMQM